MKNNIKIYQLSEFDWVAAKNLFDAIECFAENLHVTVDEVCGYMDKPIVLNKKELKTLIFRDLNDKERSFKKELENRIKRKEKFPQMFAVGE